MLDFELSLESDISARVPFSGSLAIASFDGSTEPQRSAFLAVDGFNLSHTGISYATPDWPGTDRLMVALGDERSPVLVSARVIACNKQATNAGLFEVHCEFDQWRT